MLRWAIGVVCVMSLSAGAVLAAPPPAPPPPSTVAANTPIGSGPFRAVMGMDPGLPGFTIYRPSDLRRAGQLPIVAWGNGACLNVGNAFRWFLSDIASYGYLVIALGPIEEGHYPHPPAAPMVPIAPAPATVAGANKLPPPATHSSQLIDAINWAVAQNETAASPYHHALDPQAVAVMGQSCGGAQAIEASVDPRVRTSVIWNSGLFREPTAMGGGKALSKADLNRLHAPIAYISGDDEDIAYVNANEDFDYLQHIPVLRAYGRGVLHSGTYAERNGGEFSGIAVAWLNWQLKHDTRASRMFVGPDCGLCVNPHWVVRSKNLQ
jgi:dienelactone hydrolase